MTGIYLLFIREYASAKTDAVTPDPHENTTFKDISSPKVFLNISKSSFVLLNEWSLLINSLNHYL